MTDRKKDHLQDKEPFFIGWSKETHIHDRRGFLVGAAGLILGGAGAAYGFSRHQIRAGYGTWEMGRELAIEGELIKTPYPYLRAQNKDGRIASILLVTNNKCGGQDQAESFDGTMALIRGMPIVRGQNAMLALVDREDAITIPTGPASLPTPRVEIFGPRSTRGVILDSKCFLGAMRPQEQKIHKACATLCIKGGIAPMVFMADAPAGNRLALLVDEKGEPHGETMWPYIADPLRLQGTLMARDDLLFLQSPVESFTRL